jgi:hypothetical protein
MRLPDGQIRSAFWLSVVQPLIQKNSPSRLTQIKSIFAPSRPTEGLFAFHRPLYASLGIALTYWYFRNSSIWAI